MFFKKTILICSVLLLLFSLGFNAYAQDTEKTSELYCPEDNGTYTCKRDIGGGRTSTCTGTKTTDKSPMKWNCTCQGSNEKNDNILGRINKDPICAVCGDCTLNNFLGLGINISEIILRYLGVFALLMFTIGGLIWITSGGSSDKVQLGKKIITGAVVGMVIVFGAVVLVRVGGNMLGVKKDYLSLEVIDAPDRPGIGDKELEPTSDIECTPPEQDYETTWWCTTCFRSKSGGVCWGAVRVEEYQSELNRIKCDCKGADGKFGNDTESCTRRFQESFNKWSSYYGGEHDLLDINGIVDGKTYKYVTDLSLNLKGLRNNIRDQSCGGY